MSALSRRHVLAAPLTALAADRASAQVTFPSRPIRLVVPFAPGGGSDLLARLIAPPMAVLLGQPVPVENRAGAGSAIGADLVMRSPPDGHTLLLGDTPLATIPVLQAAAGRAVPFDAATDFTAIAPVGYAPALIVVAAQSPFGSFAELLTAARATPEVHNIASGGVATSTHLMIELLRSRSGVPLTHVPYRGTGPAIQDLLGGAVQSMIQAMATAAPLVQSGQVRIIGVASERRLPEMPDVPTLKEQGVDLVAGFWWGVLGPAGMPPAVTERLASVIETVLSAPDMSPRLQLAGLERMRLLPAKFNEMIRSESARWAEVVRTAGIKPE
jgi:tripartite-type tricarboxylate transporter receptor subunit TctC